jgi:hypothetical protein
MQPIEDGGGLMGGGAIVAAARHGREQEGQRPWRGGLGEGRGGARPTRGGRSRVPRGPEGLVGWKAPQGF